MAADTYWSNVVLAMHFDGTNGSTTFTDDVGHTFAYAGTPSIQGNQLSLDGTGDYLTTPYSSAWVMDTDYTIEGYITPNLSSFGSTRAIVSTRIEDLGIYGWVVCMNANGNLEFDMTDSSGTGYGLTTAAYIGTSKAHFALTKSGNVYRLYYNGSLSGQLTITAASYVDPTSQLYVGRWEMNNHPNRDWWGTIDDLRITKGVARYTGATYTIPSIPFPESGGSVGTSAGTSTVSGASPMTYVQGAGASAGTSTASATYPYRLGAGSATGVGAASGVNAYRVGTGYAGGASTSAAVGVLAVTLSSTGFCSAWSYAVGYTYRDKGAGYSWGTSTASAGSLSAIGTGQCNAGSMARAYNPYRQGLGSARGVATASGIGRYVVGAGRAAGQARVFGRSPLATQGASNGRGNAQAISRSQGRGVSVGSGGGQAVAFAKGKGTSAGISATSAVASLSQSYSASLADSYDCIFIYTYLPVIEVYA